MGIFDRLHFNFGGEGILQLSSNVKSFINTVPSLLEPWQIGDIANNTVNGYFVNPVSTVTQTIRNTSNNLNILISSSSANISGNLIVTSELSGSSPAITSMFTDIKTYSANIGGTNGGEFISHTNRISGVTPFGAYPNSVEKPHYTTALSTGQLLQYLTCQSDGIQNNAPIMGSFTSILIENDLNSLKNTISTYYTTINNSINTSSFDDGNGNITITRTSNLSSSVVSNMRSNIITIDTTLAVRRSHDEQFYVNSRVVADEYAQLKTFSKPGDSANNMFQNYIGSDKLLTRINS